jgi:hypothetical protein
MTTIGRPYFSCCVRALALVAGGLSLSACTTVETQSFVTGKGGRVESSQIAVGADFSKYDRLQAVDMGIYFPSGTEMRPEDQQRLRQSFRDAFFTELEGYSISREPGPTTMKVEASLIDLRGSAGAGTALYSMRRDIRDLATAGSLVFLMELKDSETDKVLARAADSARAPALGTSPEMETDWQAVDAAAAHWATLFRDFLDQNLGQGTSTLQAR